MTTEQAKQFRNEKGVGLIDQTPKFRYAVYSKRDGRPGHELESSCSDESRASRFFDQYKTWGFTDTTFYFVDWQEKKMLGMYRFHKA